MKKISFLFALLCASVMSFATQYCDFPTGHENNADFGDANGRILLSLAPTGNANEYVLSIKPNVANGNTKKLDYLYAIIGDGGTTNPYPIVAGTDESSVEDELSATFTYTGGANTMTIQWSYPDWGGRWQCTLDNLDLSALEACAGGGSGDAKTASDLNINATEKTLDATNSETFQIVATTAQGYDGTVTYASSKDGIATVSASGLVTAAGRGTATITVTAPETENFAASTKKLTVTVTGPINWDGVDWLAGSDNKYKVVVDPVIPSQFGGMSKQGDDLYIGFPSAAFGEMSIEPSAGEGAWKKFALSNFPAKENQFTVVCDNKTYTFDVYYADGKDVVEIYDTNFALASNGATATASSGTAANAIDGNNGSSWESEHGVDAVTLTIDMGKLRIFNTVQLRWQTAYGKHFTIDVSNDNEAWRTIKEVNEELSDFPYEQNIELAANDTARYIRFNGIERGTQWGYNLYEFRVMLPSVPVLTTLSLTADATFAQIGDGVNLTVVAKDQINRVMEVEVEYEVSPEDAGSVVDGVYTPSKAGDATITAKSGEISTSVNIFGLTTSDNLALNKTVVAGYTPGNAGEAPSKVVDGNVGTEWTTWQNQPAANEWLYIDLGARYNLEVIEVVWGANHSTSYILQVRTDAPTAEQAADDEAWTTLATINDAVASASKFTPTDAEKVQYLRIHSLTRASVDLIRLKEIRVFGTEWVAEGDTKAPVMVSATIDSKTYNSVVLAVSASDEDGEVVKYRVVETAHEINVQLAPADGKISITGLEAETDYTFVVTAIDGADHESANNVEVEVTTDIDTSVPLVAAPAPKQKAENVRPVYSDAYTSILEHSFALSNWGSVAGVEKAIEGNHYLLYDMTAGNAVIWGENNAGGNAIVAKEGYNAGGTGENTGVDASGMDSLHMDIFSMVAMSNIEVRINDNLVRRISLTNEGWQPIDIALAEPVESINTTSVRWFKITNIVDANRQKLAFDNIYFYKKDAGITTAIDNTVEAVKAQKVIENGQLIIIKNGIRYNVAGQIVK